MTQSNAGSASVEELCAKSRQAILATTDRILELVPSGAPTPVESNAMIDRLLNRLAWHLGIWKSYGTRDTAKRVQAAERLISRITAVGSPDRWRSTRGLMVHVFQMINGMALIPDRGRLNPLLLRELSAQVEADLKALKVQFGARASRG